MSGVHCHVRASSTVVVLLCTLLCSTAWSTAIQYLYFKPRMFGSVKAAVRSLVLFKVSYCKIKNVFFIFCVCVFMYYLCEKYYKLIIVQYYMVDSVSWVPRLNLLDLTNKLDLGTRSWNGTRSYVGDLLYLSRVSFTFSKMRKTQWSCF